MRKRVVLGSFLFLFMFIFMMCSAILGGVSNNGLGGSDGEEVPLGEVSFPPLVERWRSEVIKACKKAGIPDEVNTILALIHQESGGRAEQYPDIMQASESQGKAPNTIADPIESIEVGTKYFAGLLGAGKEKKTDRLNAVQSYNYGGGFLSYAGKEFSLAKAISFAEKQAGGVKLPTTSPVAIENGYTWRYAYGNMFYAKEVEKFINSVSSSTEKGDFIYPLANSQMTSPFANRISPITGLPEYHNGVDFSNGNPQSPVVASKSGTVVHAQMVASYGNYVVIQHDSGTFTGYAHNRSMNVKVGDKVKQGQQIAIMGSTGDSTGPHCHFQVIKGSNFWRGHVDPAKYLKKK